MGGLKVWRGYSLHGVSHTSPETPPDQRIELWNTLYLIGNATPSHLLSFRDDKENINIIFYWRFSFPIQYKWISISIEVSEGCISRLCRLLCNPNIKSWCSIWLICMRVGGVTVSSLPPSCQPCPGIGGWWSPSIAVSPVLTLPSQPVQIFRASRTSSCVAEWQGDCQPLLSPVSPLLSCW